MLVLEDCWLDFLVNVLDFLWCEDSDDEGEEGEDTDGGLAVAAGEEADEISGADELNILCAPLDRGEIGACGSWRHPRSLNSISAS